jgi:hypothetical protein
VIIVCLPKGTPTDQLAATATARLTAAPLASTGPAGHFTVTTRLRRGSLLQPWKDTAAGGPIGLLDLDAMRAAARNLFWCRHQIWQQVAAGTPAAKPFWTFVDRHRADPATYPLARAQQHYQAQPRIAAMRTYNALPNRIMEVPTSHLEAFQAGGHTYAHLGWLSAVPADAMLTLDGRYLAPTSERLDARLSYLDKANKHLSTLSPRDGLVALATR